MFRHSDTLTLTPYPKFLLQLILNPEEPRTYSSRDEEVFCREKLFKASVWKTEIMEYKGKMEIGKAVRKRNMLNDTKIVSNYVIRQS
jgi:hypothetical protein